MDKSFAEAFAIEWIADWNKHDVEAVLARFSDQVVFTSPHAAQLAPGSDGVVRGKDELRRYWQAGLRAVPDLQMELLAVYVGVDSMYEFG